MALRRTRSVARVAMVVGLGLVLAACGAEEGDAEPTATTAASDAQPTVLVTEAETATATDSPTVPGDATGPTNIDMSTQSDVATPQGAAPGTATPAPVTPSSIPVGASGTPITTPLAATPTVGTPTAAPFSNDAMGGLSATPIATDPGDSQQDDSLSDELVNTLVGVLSGMLTEGDTPAAPGATPGMDATPTDDAARAPVVVNGCDVAQVPAFTGEPTHLLTADVNFRTGPGTECDLALDQPLGEFQAVEVIGGPVIREDDGSEWVQISVLGTEGWIAYEFLEPVD